jgi:hypothetical protein
VLKNLHKSDTQTAPFVVTKNWNLSNTFNDWVVLTEHSGGLPVALEYEEYLPTTASLNSSCNVALEQQDEDKILFRQGEKVIGLFYPDLESLNLDGTYKRMVYSQVQNMFYNNFRDPTKIWGLEYLDFENSQTKRFLSDGFNLYDIPTTVFGEKIVENSVVIYNQTSDNDYVIVDDGYGNLVAVRNLFSKQQEVGDFSNDIDSGSNPDCRGYFGWIGGDINLSVAEASSTINTTMVFGNLSVAPPYTDDAGIATALTSGSLLTVIITTSSLDSGSVTFGFSTGSIVTVILTTSSLDSSSVDFGFYTGSIHTQVTILPLQSEPTTINVGLSSGSLN